MRFIDPSLLSWGALTRRHFLIAITGIYMTVEFGPMPVDTPMRVLRLVLSRADLGADRFVLNTANEVDDGI